MGSYLNRNKKMIWVYYWRLFKGDITDLNINQKNINPSGIHNGSYTKFVNYLNSENEVIDFPYDWRLSVEEEAKRFSVVVEKVLERLEEESKKTGNPIRPIRILAHSMGGLVARSLMFVAPDTWNKLVAQDQFRFVMLGTPNNGAHAILKAYAGHNKIVRSVAKLDIRNSLADITKIIAEFPGVGDLIPYSTNKGSENWFDIQQWGEIEKNAKTREKAFSMPPEEQLNKSEKFYQQLADNPLNGKDLAGKVAYVAGKAEKTAKGMVVNSRGEIEFPVTPEGDGSVTWESGIPNGVPVWYMDAPHESLAAEETHFQAISELLDLGKTERLSTQKPAAMRSQQELPNSTLYDDPIEVLTQRNIDDLLTNSSTSKTATINSQISPVSLSVKHGNLKFVKGDVMVGHYLGDSIVGAEAALDDCIEGALSQSRALGVYPGSIKTSKYFYAPNSASRVEGGLVVGLGRVGDLTAGKLKATLTYALIEYLEAKQLSGGKAPLSLAVLLIGSGVAGVDLKTSLNALLDSILAANSSMQNAAENTQRAPSLISKIEIIELYKDTAIESLHVINRVIEQNTRFSQGFSISFELVHGSGSLSRVFREMQAGWWRRLDICQSNDGQSLEYKLVGDAAGAYVIPQKVQKNS